MRISTDGRRSPARFGALLALAVMAAALGAGLGVRHAYATGSFALSTNTYNVNEGDVATVTVNKTGSFSGSINIQLTFSPGSATAGTDYVDPGFVLLTFTNADTSKSFPLSTIENGAPDGARSLTVTISQWGTGDGTIGSPSNATINLIDDDGPPKYSYASASSSNVEGDPPGTHQVLIPVVRTGATSGTDNVTCTDTATGTATPGGGNDYTFSNQVLTFSPGETTKNCVVTIVEDNDLEANETVILGFTSPSGGFTVGTNATHTLTITDDDGTGTVQFSSTSYNAVEGTTASFTVTRTGGDDGAVSAVCGTVQNGTATAGTDYTATPLGGGTLNWADGDDSSKTCQVAILADADLGSGETFGITLSGANVGSPSSATVTISDTSGAGSLQFSASSYAGTENGGGIVVTVTRTVSSQGVVTVDLATTTVGSSATVGIDYTATSTTLVWANGDSAPKTWTIFPVNDSVVEGTEFVNVVLSNATGGASIGSPSLTQVNISDDESPLPVITSLSPSSGAIAGGTLVTATGFNFSGATLVTFGGFACTSLVVATANSLSCVTPAHIAGVVDVVVTTPAGSSTIVGTADDYTYTGGPTITALNPATGLASGNTIVTVTGTNFTASGTTVRFDGILAVHTFIDTTTLVAVAPPHSAGTINVSVTTPGGTTPNTAADDFVYTGASVPVVSALSPTTGTVGTTVVITGSGLSNASLVSFGGVAAAYTVNSDAQITATVPATTPGGVVDVRVTTPSGTSANTTADNFTNTSTSGNLITYTLFFRFTLIVWTGPNNAPANAVLLGQETPDNPNTNNIRALVGAIWRFDPIAQAYKGYFPGSDGVPGANDFTTLTNGQAYFFALLNAGTVTWTTLAGN